MAKAPGSLAPRTDCLGQTRTLAGWPSSPGQRNTLWATSFSISQLVSLVKEKKEIKIQASDYNDEAANINCSNIILAKMSSCQGKCFWTGGRHQEAPTLSIHWHVRRETSLAPGLDIVPFPRCKLAQSSFSAWPQELQPFNKLWKVLRFGVTV